MKLINMCKNPNSMGTNWHKDSYGANGNAVDISDAGDRNGILITNPDSTAWNVYGVYKLEGLDPSRTYVFSASLEVENGLSPLFNQNRVISIVTKNSEGLAIASKSEYVSGVKRYMTEANPGYDGVIYARIYCAADVEGRRISVRYHSFLMCTKDDYNMLKTLSIDYFDWSTMPRVLGGGIHPEPFHAAGGLEWRLAA